MVPARSRKRRELDSGVRALHPLSRIYAYQIAGPSHFTLQGRAIAISSGQFMGKAETARLRSLRI